MLCYNRPLANCDWRMNSRGASYGLLGANGCGKSLFMGVLGRRLLPIPENIDCYHVTSEVGATELPIW